ncbi:MAG: hypothetical protein FJ138_14270 [Deltaproteobacteria bacterium]|nr:hypothetical protein [Deltaproteobacteria bacterium]
MSALKVETPIFRLLDRARRGEERRHIILTGNAGDGKTFTTLLALRAPPPHIEVVHDASAVYERARDPIALLAERLAGALAAGRQLVVAINRGQLERLWQHTSKASVGLPENLRALVTQAHKRLQLMETWEESAAGLIIVDLGLVDTLSERFVLPMLNAALQAQLPDACSAPTRRAFEAAVQALAEGALARQRLMEHLERVRASGAHFTMRQLWSYLSYLLTGGRAPDDDSPLSLRDAVGARIFSEEAQGELFALSREVGDFAFISAPNLVERLLSGDLDREAIGRCAGLGFVSELRDADLKGPDLRRALLTHYADANRDQQLAQPSLSFGYIADQLSCDEWAGDQYTEDLWRGLCRHLSLPTSPADLVWRRLCYDATRWEGAPLASNERFIRQQLKLRLPAPPPEAREALEETWTPPFIWAGYEVAPGERVKLRLTPRLLAHLLSNAPQGELESLADSERHALWSWLSQLRGSQEERDVWLSASGVTLRLRTSGHLNDPLLTHELTR